MKNKLDAQAALFRFVASGVALLLLALQVACSSAQSAAHGSQHYPGKVVWHDLLTSDLDSARGFYSSLFGWSFDKGDRYTVFSLDGQEIGGIVEVDQKGDEQHVARWILSLSVSDVDEAVALLVQKGGTVHEGPGEMKKRGRAAFISDPQGAQLVIIHSRYGDPQNQPIKVNNWLWNELWTNEPEVAVDLYKELGAFSSVESLDDYWILKSGDRWRMGVRSIFEESLEKRWVPVVRVDNVLEASRRATRLGGQIVVQADSEDAVVVLADPTGALFMLQEWLGKDEAKERKGK